MDLTPYLEQLRRDLAASAAAGGTEVSRTAELLSGALEASARLCLMEALADAAAEITTRSGVVNVEVRLRGRDADLVVSDAVQAEPAAAEPPAAAMDTGADLARITLRLPEPLKEQVERAASGEGVSVNAWLVRAIAGAVAGPTRAPGRDQTTRGRRITGWAQA
jgi:predicted HicB family RNase H-like nuclease